MKKLSLLFLIAVISICSAPRQITWVALGDSITYINDDLKETNNRLTKGYLTQVVEKLPGIHYINKGYNGWTGGRIADQINKLDLQKADVYTVFLGTNDWWGGHVIGSLSDYKNNTGTATVYGSFRIIIDKLKSLNPAAKIVLMTPMQRSDFVYFKNFKNNAFGSYQPKNNQSLEEVANAINAIGKLENINVADLYHNRKLSLKHLVKFKRLKDPVTGDYKNYRYPAYIGVPFNAQTDEYPYPAEAIDLTYDGLHPGDKGCGIIAKQLIPFFKKIR
ncbi:MAG: SGNH/GDSL hydrolase family protein [Chitinophagaceae bacterium]|nr:SGNH/GDSL hydrolase family protein [Chitinophagaceae bacterium]